MIDCYIRQFFYFLLNFFGIVDIIDFKVVIDVNFHVFDPGVVANLLNC